MSNQKKVDIYFLDAKGLIDDGFLVENLISSLPVSLLERCQLSGTKELRGERTFLYSLLLYALSKRGINVNESTLLFTEFGKPYLISRECEFSLSHSDGLVCVAICDSEVGVDVQCVGEEKAPVVKRLCQRFFPDLFIESQEVSDFIGDGEGLTPASVKINLYEAELLRGKNELRASLARCLSGLGDSYFRKWAECEALLKLDGRGFGAIGEADKIKDGADVFSTAIKRPCGALAFLSLALRK